MLFGEVSEEGSEVSRERLFSCVLWLLGWPTGPSQRQLKFGHVSLVHVVVANQLVGPGELFLTTGPPAAEGFFTCMSPGVGLQMVGPGKLSLTSFTLEWFHTCMSPLVSFELV